MSGHDHHHHHHDHDNHFTPIEARVKALESLMVEKGYVDPAALDVLIDTYETKVGPRNGARVVARPGATRPTVPASLPTPPRRSPSSAITGRQGEHMVAVLEHAGGPQPRRLHALLLLPVVGARPAAGLVQGAALPFARRDGAARAHSPSSA
jgi:hypothetical protein